MPKKKINQEFKRMPRDLKPITIFSFVSFIFYGSVSKQSDLTTKLNQMQELVRQKNMVEVKLSQQLQETKKELDKERENYRAEMQEREARERALELSKRQLEEQLTAMDRENYESLQELNLLQERLQERIRVEGELREEKRT